MDKKILFIAFLLLAISTQELMARNLFKSYRELHGRPKRASACDDVGISCSEVDCDEEATCDGKHLGCYDDICSVSEADSYKKKRSVNFPM
ncbi:hypothetical protein OS493_021259 [Desmophyllum pertusum]|uniref:Uncharacterized protein n=1 Tax=Desmophyllum pertusum TaxID=174260 RepID=A0A9X0CX10_9CNID|nr:hypothetical protein OS493_021259 [Desmophyllum pertusum]